MNYRPGCDAGRTFTDLLVVDAKTGGSFRRDREAAKRAEHRVADALNIRVAAPGKPANVVPQAIASGDRKAA